MLFKNWLCPHFACTQMRERARAHTHTHTLLRLNTAQQVHQSAQGLTRDVRGDLS